MSEAPKPVINLDDVDLRPNAHGDRFEANVGSFGGTIGLTSLGLMLHEVPAGKIAFPYHAHHLTEEAFLILEGEGIYRFGDKEYSVKANDVCAAPPGTGEVAHQLINTGEGVLRYLGLSSSPGDSDVIEYPDSQKFAVSSRFDWASMSGGVRYVGRVENSLEYWDGEN